MPTLVIKLVAHDGDGERLEVIWVVGDEAILKSDVEVTRLQAEAEGIRIYI